MLIENVEKLKEWLTNALLPICEADPGALAKYVVALVKKDKTKTELKDSCLDQLEVFLQSKTKDFVEILFDALENRKYITENETAAGQGEAVAPPHHIPVTAPHTSGPQPPEPATDSLLQQTSVKPLEIKKRKEEVIKEDLPPREIRRRRSRSPSPRNRDDRRHRYDDRPPAFDRHYPRRTSGDRSRSISPRSRARVRRRSRSPIRRRSPFRPIQRSRSPRLRGKGRGRSRSKSWSRSWSRSPRRSWSRSRSGSRSRFRSRSRSPPRMRSVSRSPKKRSRSPRLRSPVRPRSPRRSRSRSRSPRSPRRRSKSPRMRSRSPRSRSRSPRKSRSKSLSPVRRVRRQSPDSRGPTPTQDNGLYEDATVPGSSSAISVVTVGRYTGVENPTQPHPARQGMRCRDFDEKGFCMRGDTCPYDHGLDPVIVEDVSIPPPTGHPFPPAGPPPRPGMPPVSRAPIGPRGPVIGQGDPRGPPPGFPPPGMPFPGPNIRMGPPRPDFPMEVYNPEAPGISVPPPPYWPGGPPPPHFMQGPPPPPSSGPPPLSLQSQTLRQRDLVNLTIKKEVTEDSEDGDPPSSSTRTVIAPKEEFPVKVTQPPPPGVPAPETTEETKPSLPSQQAVTYRQQRYHPFHGNPRYGGGPRKPFDYNRIGGYRKQEPDKSNCTLEVRKVPSECNNIAKLNEHFSKFGTLVNIQVAFEGDPEAALITYTRNAEAHSAYKSSEPVFNNRFIKLFWHKSKTDGDGNSQEQAPTSTTTPGSGAEDGTQPSLKARLGPLPTASQLQLNNTVKKTEAQSSQINQATERNIVYTSSMGNISKTVYNPEALRTKAAHKSLSSPTAVKAADFVSKMEALKRQETLKQEAAKTKLELQKQKQQLLEKQIKQQKILIQKIEQNKGMAADEKGSLMHTLKTLTISIDKLKAELLGRKVVLKTEQPTIKSPEQAKKEILDTELELMTKQKSGADTIELKKRLAELTKEASSMGLLGRGRGRGVLVRGRGSTTWVAAGKEPPAPVLGMLGRGRGGIKAAIASRTLDRRPKQLEVSGFKVEEKEDIHLQLQKLNEVEKIDMTDIPSAIVTFKTRYDAEMGILAVGKLSGNKLKIQWYIGKPSVSRSLSGVSADTNELDPEGNFDDIDEEALLAGEEEEEDEDEDRSWRR